MNGSLETASLSQVERERDHGQASLYDYGSAEDPKTYIAVVTDPNDTGILDATDEWMPELGIPSRKLNEFRRLREGYNSQDPVECHNKAYLKCDFDKAFESHVRYNEDAKEKVEEIANRVQDGEEVVLVCFEESPKRCHRHKLKEIIESEIQPSAESGEHTRPQSSYAEYAE